MVVSRKEIIAKAAAAIGREMPSPLSPTPGLIAQVQDTGVDPGVYPVVSTIRQVPVYFREIIAGARIEKGMPPTIGWPPMVEKPRGIDLKLVLIGLGALALIMWGTKK